MDQTTAFQKAVDQTAQIVANVKPDQLGQPTPCTEWDVNGLLNHTIGGLYMFDAAARGEKLPDDFFNQDKGGKDPGGAYYAAAKKHKEALGEPGAPPPKWGVPVGPQPGLIAPRSAMIQDGLAGWLSASMSEQRPCPLRAKVDTSTIGMSAVVAVGAKSPASGVPGVCCPIRPPNGYRPARPLTR